MNELQRILRLNVLAPKCRVSEYDDDDENNNQSTTGNNGHPVGCTASKEVGNVHHIPVLQIYRFDFVLVL